MIDYLASFGKVFDMPSPEISNYMSELGRKGGKTITAKRRAASITNLVKASKGRDARWSRHKAAKTQPAIVGNAGGTVE